MKTSAGDDGADGTDGEDGDDGADGTDGEDGDDGADDTDGEHGDEGAAKDQRVLTRPLMIVIEGVPASQTSRTIDLLRARMPDEVSVKMRARGFHCNSPAIALRMAFPCSKSEWLSDAPSKWCRRLKGLFSSIMEEFDIPFGCITAAILFRICEVCNAAGGRHGDEGADEDDGEDGQHGEDGDEGADEDDGEDGPADGEDGEDAPEDGEDGEDAPEDGDEGADDPMAADGEDGEDAPEDGADVAMAASPQFLHQPFTPGGLLVPTVPFTPVGVPTVPFTPAGAGPDDPWEEAFPQEGDPWEEAFPQASSSSLDAMD